MELTKRIENYWSKRSDDFCNLRMSELKSDKRQLWENLIISNIPDKEGLKILDVGTGTGFFSIILTSLGYEVVGIDLCNSMITNSNKTAKLLGYDINFKVMNAQELDFEDEVFDVVISRNLTWTLPDVEKAYKEWYRVLKSNGVLLNFDGDYGRVSFSKQVEELDSNHAHAKIGQELTKECDDIKEELNISSVIRPQWDIEVLNKVGFGECNIDELVSEKIYKEEDELYNPTKMFGIFGKKLKRHKTS